MDSYIAAGLIQDSPSPWSSLLECVPKKSDGIRITANHQKLNKVTAILQITIICLDKVLDTLDGGSVFSVLDLFLEFTLLTIHPVTIPLTVFCIPDGLYEWLRMPQGATDAPAWLVSVMRLNKADLDTIRMYLDDAIRSNNSPISSNHVTTLAAFFARVRLHKMSTLTRMPIPTDIKQLGSVLGGLSYYCKFLPNMAERIRPNTAILKKGARFDFVPAIDVVYALLVECTATLVPFFSD